MNWRKYVFSINALWVSLGVLAIAVRPLFSKETVEAYYSRGLFPVIRTGFDAVTRWVPFALVYLLFFIVLFVVGRWLLRFFRRKEKWLPKLGGLLFSLLALAGGLIFFFQLLWGFNYDRIPLENILNIEPKPLEVTELRQELDSATADVLRFRAMLPIAADSAVAASFLPKDIENTMRENLTKMLQKYGYPTPGNVRARQLVPKGILLRISTAGIYIPFTGEGHVDKGLHHLQLPFVMAHEMSHGYGFGDEGSCNFWAWMACTHSDDPFLQYAGHLYYWRYVASDYRDLRPEEYDLFKESLPEGMRQDLLNINLEMEKYPDLMPVVRDAAYTAYLQAQGIPEGLKNYDRVIMLVHAWRAGGR